VNQLTEGKTVYRFQFNSLPQHADAVVQGWLQTHQFTYQNKYGEDMYFHSDNMNGHRGFQYMINGNVLTIYAWTMGLGKKYYKLDSGAVKNMPGDSYKYILHELFIGIRNLGTVAAAPVQHYTQPQAQYYEQPQAQYYDQAQGWGYGQYQAQSVNDVVNEMGNDLTQKAETGCEIGFWMSIVGLLVSFLGITYGVFVYVAVFYLAGRGLKTRKRGKAIASIVMSIASILITALKLVGVF
jgi:hypothetical protein